MTAAEAGAFRIEVSPAEPLPANQEIFQGNHDPVGAGSASDAADDVGRTEEPRAPERQTSRKPFTSALSGEISSVQLCWICY